jgi:hypothetical protein
MMLEEEDVICRGWEDEGAGMRGLMKEKRGFEIGGKGKGLP